MYIYIHIYTYIREYIYIYTYICKYASVLKWVYTYISAQAALKLLNTVFEAKCVDLHLKPLKERRQRKLCVCCSVF